MSRKAAYRNSNLDGISTMRGNRRHTTDGLSPLNIATSARFRACLATGGHERSGKEVWRPVGSVNAEVRFRVCARCDVPYMRAPVLGLNNRPVMA